MSEGNHIGIVGGGQLGRMLTEAAKPMGFEVTVLETSESCPAAQAGADVLVGDITDDDAIFELSQQVDVVTWEIEHIGVGGLRRAAESGVTVYPSPDTLETIQDKLDQKNFLQSRGLPVAPFRDLAKAEDLSDAVDEWGEGQVIVKTRRGGYDGRGNMRVTDAADWLTVQERFVGRDLYAEQIIAFQKELSVIAVRDVHGNIVTYPVVQTIHRDNICHTVLSPAPTSTHAREAAEEVARETLRHLAGAGVFAIEMFLDEDDDVLINEIAPRVHNSGHHTIEGNVTSQFEQHIRAISGLPLGRTAITNPSVMINILGERDGEVALAGREKVLALPDTHLHLYGKAPTKPARKMGHITVVAGSVRDAQELAVKAREELSI